MNLARALSALAIDRWGTERAGPVDQLPRADGWLGLLDPIEERLNVLRDAELATLDPTG
jgi:hypothetical protein